MVEYQTEGGWRAPPPPLTPSTPIRAADGPPPPHDAPHNPNPGSNKD